MPGLHSLGKGETPTRDSRRGWAPHANPRDSSALTFLRERFPHQNTTHMNSGEPCFAVRRTPGSAIVLRVSGAGDAPQSASPAAGQSFSAPREQGVPGGAADHHKILHKSLRSHSKMGNKAPRRAASPRPGSVTLGLSPGPRTAPRRLCRGSPSTRPARRPALPGRGSPSLADPTSHSAGLLPLRSARLKPRRPPPSLLSLPILHPPSLASRHLHRAPALSAQARPLLSPSQTPVPAAPHPRLSHLSPPSSSALPILAQSEASAGAAPLLGFSAAQTPASSPGPGLRLPCAPRSKRRGGSREGTRWAPAARPGQQRAAFVARAGASEAVGAYSADTHSAYHHHQGRSRMGRSQPGSIRTEGA